MTANPNSGASKTARVSRLADSSVAAASRLAATVLASTAAAFFAGPTALREWTSLRLGLILYVIPAPDLIFSFVSVTWKSARADYIQAGIIDLFLAGLMAAIAFGIGKARPWGYWAYSVVCLSAVIGRTNAIWQMSLPRPYRFMPFPTLLFVLDVVEVAVGVSAAWYVGRRAAFVGAGQASVARSPKRASVSITSVPWVTLTFAALALVCVSVRTAYLFNRIDSWQERYELLRFVLIALAYVSVLAVGLVRPTRRLAASPALGIAVMGLLTAGGAEISPGMFLRGLAWAASQASREPEAIAVAAFLLCNILLAAAALVSLIRRRTFHIGMVALAVIFVGGIDPATRVLRQYDIHRTNVAQAFAGGGPYILFRTGSCLLRFRMARGSARYPDSLAQVDAALPRCLQSGLAKGREIGGYRVEYSTVGPSPVAHFSLIAIPSVRDTQGMISFFADETGIVRALTGNRLARASDGGVTPAQDFYTMRRCVHDFDRLFGGANSRTPAENQSAQGSERFPVSFAEMAPRDRCYLRGQLDGDGWKAAAYRFSYREFGPDGADNFALSARPLEYAVTGLRSYLMDNTFVVHATSEDRDATASDPVADACEFLSLVPCGEEQATLALPK